MARFFLAYGSLLWIVATAIFRFFGQAVLESEDAVASVVPFAMVVPGVAALTYPIFALAGLDGRGRLVAAVCMALPGMVLDVLALAFFQEAYPNLPIAVAPYFGALLMWAYAIVLLTGLFPTQTFRQAGKGE